MTEEATYERRRAEYEAEKRRWYARMFGVTEEKPLHVRVAEALGCRILPCSIGGWICGCDGGDHQENGLRPQAGYEPMAHYDIDWSATGPLIEKYKITVLYDVRTAEWDSSKGAPWEALYGAYDDLQFGSEIQAQGSTPLVAVCHLILALKEAGKL